MSQTILLVEDNQDNQTIYRVILEHYGYRVLVAGDGERGVAVARENVPDAILMDVTIPIIDGHQATRILKAEASTAHIPIIILTAHAMAEDRASAFECGGDGFIAKPAEPKRVAEEIRRVLAGTPG